MIINVEVDEGGKMQVKGYIEPDGAETTQRILDKLTRFIEDDQVATVLYLRPLLDYLLTKDYDLTDYNERNELIDEIEATLLESSKIATSNGTTYTQTFKPSED